MNIAKLCAVLVAGTISAVAITGSALAASPATDAFLANVTPNVDFLDRSSRMALLNTKSARVKDFAHSEAANQTEAANALYDATGGARTASAPQTESDTVVTGRSVAVDGQTTAVADTRMPLGQEDLDSLEGLTGAEFDELYKAKQRDALAQLETDYKDYIAKGDDPLLLAIAGKELPKIRHRIALLGKI